MQIEIFAIADAATDNQGKLNILGAFDTISAPNVPALHPFCAVAIRLRFLAGEGEYHPLELNIVDEFGVSIMPTLQLDLRIGYPQGLPSAPSNVVANIQSMRFMRFGRHEIRLNVDGKQISSIPLLVNQTPS